MMNSGFDCDVVVGGAGPTGLAAALSLAVQGVHVRIVDDMPLRHATPRASSIHARTLEVYRRELRAIDSQYPAHQNLQPWHAEWIIAEQLMARTVTVEASTRAAGLVQDGSGVTAHIETDAGASALRCRLAGQGQQQRQRGLFSAGGMRIDVLAQVCGAVATAQYWKPSQFGAEKNGTIDAKI